MELKKIIIYLIIIIIILVGLFFSQQAYSGKIGKSLLSNAASQAGAYFAKGANWAMSAIYPKISEEVKSGGDAIINPITDQVEQVKNIPQNILEKVENYFSGIGTSITQPGTPQNCPATPTN